jgi:NAD(P)-dependent dehydrogenase (short-subunit alcohol dehydrogenase family)
VDYFEGKRVLVTGGSSGIGAAIASRAAAAGAHSVVVARRETELAEVCARIHDQGGRADYLVADLSDLEACDRVVAETESRWGPVDVLVNNAGRSIRRPLAESLERFHDFDRIMAINFFAPVRLIRACLPSMRARGGGRIVNVLSAGARMPAPRFGVYTSSKAALAQLGDTLNAEHGHENILVTSAFLSWVRTDMVSKKYAKNSAMTPDEAARWILSGVADEKPHLIDKAVARRSALNLFAPRAASRLMNLLYRIYADDPDDHPEVAVHRAIAKRLIRGRPM